MQLSRWIRRLKAMQAVAALPFILVCALPARTEIISVQDMLRGASSTPTQCSAVHDAVWVSVKGRSFCMRYYLSEGTGEVRRPVVFLQGDRLGVLNLRTGAFTVPPGEKDVDTDELMKVAVAFHRQTKLPAIYLARVGLEGSSGDHRLRHSLLELEVTNAAIEAIKQKHHYEGFHLIGQSGGAHLVAGLLSLRQDIGCAVIGSGPLTPVRRPKLDDPELEHFNPLNDIGMINRNQAGRIMVVTDPADKKVSAATQSRFVQLLQQSGRQVDQFIVEATDENRHGVVAYSRIVLSGCLRNASAGEIGEQITKYVKLRVDPNKPKVVGPSDASADRGPAAGNSSNLNNSIRMAPRSAPSPESLPRGRTDSTTHMGTVSGN